MILNSLPYLLRGWLQTVTIAGASIAMSLLFGILLGVLATYGFHPVRWLLMFYVNLMRGVPVLIVLFLGYFSLPAAGIILPDTVTVTLALTLYGSALVLENVRGAIRAVGVEQVRAAESLGMRAHQRLIHVIATQAAAIALPLLLNTAVHLIKCTAFVSIVGVWELSFAAREVTERTMSPFQVMFVVMALYYFTCFPLGHLAKRFEHRYTIGRKTAGP